MTALERALIKAYRAESAGAAAAVDLAPRILPESNGAGERTVTFHAAEPRMSGPHWRARGAAPQVPPPVQQVQEPVIVKDEAPISFGSIESATAGMVFRVDVGCEGMPLSEMPAPLYARPMCEAPVVRPAFAQPISEAPVQRPSGPAEARPAIDPPRPGSARLAYSEPACVEQNMEPESKPRLAIATETAVAPLTMRPLSSFTEQAAESEELHPQLVVDRFIWPEICEQMEARAGRGFDEFSATLSALRLRGKTAVAFVGLEPSAGCTTTLLCVARRLAASGLRPALLDADFARPRLAERLSVAVMNSWIDALSGSLPLEDALIESLEDHIVLAALNGPSRGLRTMTAGLRSSLVWRRLKDSHDLLMIDAGTVHDEASAATLKTLAENVPLDGVYAVCDDRTTSPDDIAEFAQLLSGAGVRLLGIIENFGGADADNIPELTLSTAATPTLSIHCPQNPEP